jgi:hypothetical protein
MAEIIPDTTDVRVAQIAAALKLSEGNLEFGERLNRFKEAYQAVHEAVTGASQRRPPEKA